MLRSTLLITSLLILSAQVSAKESKYERNKKKSGLEQTLIAPAPQTAPTKDGAVQPAASPAPAGDVKKEKVDISDLENRYWAPKDTEFSVVQNRLYTKAKRFSVQVGYGSILNDAYNSASNLGVVGNYYFSERQGVELQFFKTFATDSDMVQTFKGRNGITPNYNIPQWYLGAGFNWVPIYAKMSLLEKKILYFDMFVTPGIGITNLLASRYTGAFSTGVTTSTGNAQNAITLALDVGQQVFLSEQFALRLDLRNHFYQEQIYEANTSFGDTVQRTKLTYQGTAILGVTYFFH
jgi:outer membrane beta-barrel protein